MPYPKSDDHIAQMADQDEWASAGSCQADDARLFDTRQVNKKTLVDEDTETAMDICADCPVMMRCLEHAVRFDVTEGVWGGMVYEQRLAWAIRNRPDWIPEGQRHLYLVAAA
jgi:WhiB family transcriptional regulator, redox-sensing transcriptional regulator